MNAGNDDHNCKLPNSCDILNCNKYLQMQTDYAECIRSVEPRLEY